MGDSLFVLLCVKTGQRIGASSSNCGGFFAGVGLFLIRIDLTIMHNCVCFVPGMTVLCQYRPEKRLEVIRFYIFFVILLVCLKAVWHCTIFCAKQQNKFCTKHSFSPVQWDIQGLQMYMMLQIAWFRLYLSHISWPDRSKLIFFCSRLYKRPILHKMLLLGTIRILLKM